MASEPSEAIDATLTHLDPWFALFLRLQHTTDGLCALFRAEPESEVITLLHDLFHKTTLATAASIDDILDADDEADTIGWLEWFLWENDGGKKGMEAGFTGQTRPVRTLRDIAVEGERRLAAQPERLLIDRVRRAWTESALTTGDPSKLAERIANMDPDLLTAWFTTPQQQQALGRLRRIGNALATRHTVTGMGAYESLGAVTVIGSLLRGNLSAAITTAIGFEGIPAFLSWAMYTPSVQRYLFEAAAPTASVTSKMAALLHAVGAYRAATEQAEAGATP